MTGAGCLLTLAAGWAAAVLLGAATAVARAVIGALPVMLALGVLHRVAPDVPPFGLFETFVLLFAFGLVATAVVSSPISVDRKKDAS